MTTLIVGGYGSVGRTIAGELADAPDGPSEVLVAGRDEAKANAVADRLGDGVTGTAFDLADADSYRRALDGVERVVVCVDQSDTAFAEACLERGVDYVDVTASDEFFRRVEALDDTARDNGATAVLSVGLAPGGTNLLAKREADRLRSVSAIRIGVLLGLGEAFGPAASRWTLERIGRSFAVEADGGSRLVRGFTDPAPVEFPRYGRRTAYRFDFADQHALARTMDVPTSTRLCFDSRAVSTAAYALARSGAYRRIVDAVGLDRLTGLALRLPGGGDGFAVTVEVDGQRDSTPVTLTAGIDGREQSRATAVVAAAVAASVGDGVPDGVHHVHEAFDEDPILDALRDRGYRLTKSERVDDSSDT